jgi:hypothetical protein
MSLAASSGDAIMGHATATSGITSGVLGQADSNRGRGVTGWAIYNGGWGNAGVYGRTDGASTSYGVAGYGSDDAVGMGAWSDSGNLIEAYSGTFPDVGARRFYIDQFGNVYVTGSYNSITRMAGDSEAGHHALSALASPEAWYEDFGSGALVDGQAVVTVEALFAQAVNLEAEYHVFLTPVCTDPVSLFVSDKNSRGFTVRGVALDGAPSECAFDYRIVAKPLGAEGVRLEQVHVEVRPKPERTDSPSVSPTWMKGR